MIRGLHGLFYSKDAEAARAFLRDMLGLPFTDVGGGWLIFDLPEGDLGVHPVEAGDEGGAHDVSFYCDDIEGTVAELRARGVQFRHDPADHGYGYVTYFTMPGGVEVQLYEPKYEKKQAKHEKKQAPKARPKVKATSKPRVVARAQAKGKPKPKAKAKAKAKKPAAKRR
jgi:catechol 2,3-dioxygenase-like lactoylglutathione lyase family enzyme